MTQRRQKTMKNELRVALFTFAGASARELPRQQRCSEKQITGTPKKTEQTFFADQTTVHRGGWNNVKGSETESQSQPHVTCVSPLPVGMPRWIFNVAKKQLETSFKNKVTISLGVVKF